MQRKYVAKHYNGNLKINYPNKLLIVVIVLILLAFNSVSGILSYFTFRQKSINNFTLAGKYTVHFDANNGTGTMPDQKIYAVHYTNLNSNTFTRTGFGFGGWNTEPDGTGTQYEDEASVKDLAAVNSSITLYAQWRAGVYAIKYHLNDGTVETSNPTTYTPDTETFTLNNPTKTGYTFKGWSGTDLTGDENLTVTITKGSTGDRTFTANYIPYTYYIRFNANSGTGTMENQTIAYGTAENLTANSFEKPEHYFTGWNTEPNGSGTSYEDEEEISNLTTTNGQIIDLYAQWKEETNEAEIIGGKKYATVQQAINAASSGNKTTIRLLKNVHLKNPLNVAAGKNIVFNLQNYTLDNGTMEGQIIKNNATFEIIGGPNGKIQTSAAFGAIDNNSTGKLTVSSGSIITTGKRQAIYNNGGTVEIKGSAYLSTNSPERATIQNHKPDSAGVAGGTVTISGGTIISVATTVNGAIDNEATTTLIVTGGTIISQNSKGIDNKGTLTIGVKDEDVDTSSPIIQGATYGVYSESSKTLEFYDGTVKGKTHAFNNESYITDMETNVDLVHGSETIDGYNYETAYLNSAMDRLIFNANGGTPAETIVPVEDNTAIGEQLPAAPTRERYSFDGWFTDPTGGTEITSSTIITKGTTYYAHWTQTEALITFEAQGGTSTANTLIVNCGSSIGSSNLPTATKPNKTFDGWFTDPTAGTQIDGTETITKDETYYAHWSAENITVTFDPNLGTIPSEDATRTVEVGDEIGTLPTTATRTGYGFAGWYTAPSGGTKINAKQVVTEDITYYAHWLSSYVAEIDSVKYATLQAAVNDVPTDNTETTITLLADTLEAVDVSAGKNIVLDLQNYTLYNNGTKTVGPDTVAIRNRGTIKISSGTVTANAKAAAINNETGGRLIITGGSITNTGTGNTSTACRQAVYNNGGILEISGTAYLSAKNDGAYNGNDRGAVQNLNHGTITITGGTIESFTSHAIVNQSGCTLTIGTEDGTPNSTTPVIQGKKYGIQNKATFNFYDGIVKGITGSISGTVTATETGTTRTDDTETIGTDTYHTTCYE